MRKIINDGVEVLARNSQSRFSDYSREKKLTCLTFPCLGLSTIIDSFNHSALT